MSVHEHEHRTESYWEQLDYDSRFPERYSDLMRQLLPLKEGVCVCGGENGIVLHVGTGSSKSGATVIRLWGEEHDVRSMAFDGDQQVAVGMERGPILLYNSTVFNDAILDPDLKHPGIPLEDFDVIRDLKFIGKDYLAVAHEAGFSILHLPDSKKYLEHESALYHHGSGIRTLALVEDEDEDGTSNKLQMIATLAMDGRVGLWDISSTDPQEWDIVALPDDSPIAFIPKEDNRAHSVESDAWDQSCRPYYHAPCQILLVPGESFVQYLDLRDGISYHALPDSRLDTESSIVAYMALSEQVLVTTTRDKRVMVWKLKLQNEVSFTLYRSKPTTRIDCISHPIIIIFFCLYCNRDHQILCMSKPWWNWSQLRRTCCSAMTRQSNWRVAMARS